LLQGEAKKAASKTEDAAKGAADDTKGAAKDAKKDVGLPPPWTWCQYIGQG